MSNIFEIFIAVIILILVIKYFIIPNIKFIQRYFYLKKNGILYKAEIIEYLNQTDNDGVIFYIPVIRFTSKDGQIIIGKLSIGKPKSDLKVEKFTEVYSDVHKPDEFIEKSLEQIIVRSVALLLSILSLLITINFIYITSTKLL